MKWYVSGLFLDKQIPDSSLIHVQKLLSVLPRELAPCYQTFLHHILNSKAVTTQRSYLREISHWIQWCHNCNLCPIPATAASVGLYLSFRLSKAASKSSVEQAHAAIAWIHELFGVFPNPARSDFCRLLPEAARRLVPGGHRQKKALSLVNFHRVLCCLLTPDSSGYLPVLQLCTAALVSLMYYGLLRIAETLALRLSDLEWHNTFLVVNVLGAKGNVYREQRKVPISVLDTYCPIRLLHRFFREIQMENAPPATPVFPRLQLRGKNRYTALSLALSDSAARALISAAFSAAGLDHRLYSTHSLRSEGASQALAQGISVERVMRHGRWSSYAAFAHYWDEDLSKRAQVSCLSFS